MCKDLRSKLFLSTLGIITLSFVFIFFVQSIVVNELYVPHMSTVIGKHLDQSSEFMMAKGLPELSKKLKKQLASETKFKKTFIQIYSKDWQPQLKWFNPQLLSAYYVEIEGNFYRLLIDKYTNVVYKRELLVADYSLEYSKRRIMEQNIVGMNFKTVWTFDGSEIVYFIKKDNQNISLKIKHLENNPQNSEYKNIPEINGVLLRKGNEDVNLSYSYVQKFMAEKTQGFLINEIKFSYEDKTLINEVDPYTGGSHLLMIKPVFIKKKLYYLTYLNMYDDLRILNPLKAIDSMIIIVALLLSGILAFVYANKVTKPILEIRHATHMMANLDFTTRCYVESNDEIEALADDINSMADQLQIKTGLLSEEVEKMKQIEEFRKSFIAISSHEFRTPLTIMRGILEGLEDGMYESGNREPLKVMAFEIESLEILVEELITITKNEVNAIVYEKKFIQLMDIVQQGIHRYKYIIKDYKLIFDKKLEEGFIHGDEEKIALVIKNVLSNAIKYADAHTSIKIRVHDRGESMVFTVENEGSHLDENNLQMIWEPFCRGDVENKKIAGYGIGLYTSKLILTAHDAMYSLKNTDNGVLFTAVFKKYSLEDVIPLTV